MDLNHRGHLLTALLQSILAGIGSGIQQTMPVLMGELVPNKYRHMQLAATFVLFGPISAIGPGLGENLSEIYDPKSEVR